MATDPDRTVLFFLGSGSSFIRRCESELNSELILLITFKAIVDVCQNIRQNVQNVVAYWWIWYGFGSQNFKGLGSESLFVGSGSFKGGESSSQFRWFTIAKIEL